MIHRSTSIWLALFAVVAAIGFGIWFSSKPYSEAAEPAVNPPDMKLAAADAHRAAGTSGSPAPDASPAVAAETIAQWTTDATGGDATKRAAAITALAHAPVAQALPVLRRVLMNGEPAVDRPLALQALRDLALDQGDANNVIRNVIREAIYHGDDETMSAAAQEALDVIEESALR